MKSNCFLLEIVWLMFLKGMRPDSALSIFFFEERSSFQKSRWLKNVTISMSCIVKRIPIFKVHNLIFCNLTIENQSCFCFAGCCGTFCGLCLVCQNANGMNKSGVLYGLLTCLIPCIPILLLRQEARDKYQIEVSFH